MSKKRNRQPDANPDVSEASTESCEETSSGAKCLHIAKAINLNKVKKNLKKTGILSKCSMCKKLEMDLNAAEKVCDISKPLWICLQCGEQGCSKEQKQHAFEHYRKPHSDCHCMVMDSHHWSVWCYQCEIEVHPNSRKKLLETVEFIKKYVNIPQISQSKMQAIQCQKETIIDVQVKEHKILNNLPKVGGLANLGNTCFFNAVLQCLSQTPYLVKVLDDLRVPGQKFVLPGGKHKPVDAEEEVELPPIEGTLERWGSFTSILCETLSKMQNTNGHQTYTPLNLLCKLRKKTTQCVDGGQHDSHEFLRHLLEIVRNEDLRRYQSIILKEVGLSEKTKPDCVEKSLKSRVKFYGNQASTRLLGPEAVFRGVLVSTLECLDCHHSSQRTEPFLDLSLPVTADKPQPPLLKRKNSEFEDAFDMMNIQRHDCQTEIWKSEDTPWKQLKKEKKAARKNRKNKRHENYNNSNALMDLNNPAEENTDNILKSEESDADVEDNIEMDNSHPEIGESGYSSEKASAVTSPVSPADHHHHHHHHYHHHLNNDFNGTISPENSNLDNRNLDPAQVRHPVNINALTSPSPTDVSMTDLTEIRMPFEKTDRNIGTISSENEVSATALTSPIIVNSNVTSPEIPTASLSSSAASKESPTSPVNNEEIAERLDGVETWMATTLSRYGRRKYNNGTSNGDDPEEQDVYNELGDIVTGMSRLGIAGHQSPGRYTTKEGECSVESCLNQFTALELMTGSNKVVCEACTAREKKNQEGSSKMVCTSSTKQYLISQVPPILILHLKRFQTQRVGFRKVFKHVSFPILLDLAPVCTDRKKSRLYALYGVVEHSGTVHGGHYVAYVKTRLPLSPDDPRWKFLPKDKDPKANNESSSSDSDEEEASAKGISIVEPPPGKWYYVSDSRVSEVDENTVLQSQAYLLFYERIL
ncbi:ubiquitin carboxyl-terminal hydrolase 16 isoform X3 [Mycetomoellerius zeteki]|uniref:ubiquitin carboxyl-terminal hydrolase 16 isoform X3 n=1 Tax=Mycetomoellerius zeteki TaxID=64791 RepID=UPI00084E40BE|nr:PREDICTED: ubiquitin carboxyl-terminal hydrolase 16 isoform X3 [Trachymyrmex zeteki]